MHKVITFGIPSYNAAKDMDHCITSILEGNNYATDIEIIIVDDGSKDETAAKADEWETRYPGIIRAVHQENGGHGIAVLIAIMVFARQCMARPEYHSLDTQDEEETA